MDLISGGESPQEEALVHHAVEARTAVSHVPPWMHVHRVPVWWFEALLVVAFDVAYEHVRNMVRMDPVRAIDHGLQVFRFAQWFDSDIEQDANHFLMSHQWLCQIANYDYSTMHLPVTGGVLVWVFWKYRDRYLAVRNVLLCTTLLGLVGFWLYPMAPPRLLPGHRFIDTVVQFHTWGSWGDPKVADTTNQFAAMPSLHCAWALWAGLCVFFLARNRVLRTFGLIYPAWTVFVVLGTANHFLLDAIAGIACVGVSTALVTWLNGQAPWSTSCNTQALPPTSEPEFA